MSELVTLEVADEVVARARSIAQQTGQQPEGVLTAWLLKGASVEVPSSGFPVDAAGLPVLTPYDNEAAAEVLLGVLMAASSGQHPEGDSRQ